MPYEYLKKIGAEYGAEKGLESADRRQFLKDVEAQIQGKLAMIKAFEAASAGGPKVASGIPPFGTAGRVKDLVKFHMQQQDNTIALNKLNGELVWLRQWIFRQGASLSADGKVRWASSFRTVQYDADLERRNMSRVQFRGGLLYMPNGKLLDTRNMVTAHSGPGFAIFVMSAEGHIHAGSHAVGHRHHSSFLAGGDVAGAGELKVLDGRLLWISNKSGHYQPDLFMLLQVIQELKTAGVPLNFRIREYPSKKEHPTLDSFLAGNLMDDVSYRYHRLSDKYGAETWFRYLLAVGLMWSAENRCFVLLNPPYGFADFDQVVNFVTSQGLVPHCWERSGELKVNSAAGAA
jgi:hypothetical protein